MQRFNCVDCGLHDVGHVHGNGGVGWNGVTKMINGKKYEVPL
jgi:hypothetical protein